MITFSRKVREYMFARAGYLCECRGAGCLLKKKLALHHIYPNTKVNRTLHGDKLQSTQNAEVKCEHCHTQYPGKHLTWRKKLIYII